MGWIAKLGNSQIGKKAGAVFVINWVSNVLRFLLGIYIVRVFGADGKGIYFLIQASTAVAAVSLSFGITNALVFYLKKNRLRIRQAVHILIGSAAAVTLVASLLLYAFGDFFWQLLFDKVPFTLNWVCVLLIYIPILFVTVFLRAFLLSNRDTKQYFCLTALAQIFVILATIALTWDAELSLDMVMLASVLVEGIVTSSILSRVYYKSDAAFAKASTKSEQQQEPVGLSEIVQYGMRGHPGSVGSTLAVRADTFLLAGLVSTTAVGYYSVAKFFFQAMNSIPQALNGLLFGYYCEKETKAALKLNSKIAGYIGLAMAGCALIGMVAGGPFIRTVYGADFEQAVLPLKILLGSGVLLGFASPFIPLFLSREMPGTASIIGVCSGALRVSLGYFLISRYSINGAAIASIIASAVMLAMCVALSVRLRKGLRGTPAATALS